MDSNKFIHLKVKTTLNDFNLKNLSLQNEANAQIQVDFMKLKFIVLFA